MNYDLVYILVFEHVNLPLVLSQTFDQAQKQSEINGQLKPVSVSVWVMTPLRFFFGKKGRNKLKYLHLRCPNINIKLLPEINRLNNFPLAYFLNYRRKMLMAERVVFHFRTETTLNRFGKYYNKRQSDLFILDVRGYWPAELLYAKGIEDVEKLSSDLEFVYTQEIRKLELALKSSDGVITVSQNLAKLLRQLAPSLPRINVIPCSVGKIHQRTDRKKLRQSLGVHLSEKLLVYSGGYARYQHLEDLTIPFMNLILHQSDHIKVLILSPDIDLLKKLVKEMSTFYNRFIFLNVEQSEVASYLSACDLGFLLRKESLVNIVAQPVKVGEYLAAGVPICVEGEVGGITSELVRYGAGLSINIVNQTKDCWLRHSYRVLDFLKSDHSKNAQLLAKEYFLWEKNILMQRQYYWDISSTS